MVKKRWPARDRRANAPPGARSPCRSRRRFCAPDHFPRRRGRQTAPPLCPLSPGLRAVRLSCVFRWLSAGCDCRGTVSGRPSGVWWTCEGAPGPFGRHPQCHGGIGTASGPGPRASTPPPPHRRGPGGGAVPEIPQTPPVTHHPPHEAPPPPQGMHWKGGTPPPSPGRPAYAQPLSP